jgi:pimeloyl-ACP methyl ester carboxylesterase
MTSANGKPSAALGPFADALEYGVDAVQRSILYWDVMRKRGNQFVRHFKEGKPPVLVFDYEIVVDGRQLEKPVNYALLRVIPKPGTTVDPAKRPFVIVDPRAGHGPGIGGFKEASQVGVAMRAGHPCYFVSFFPQPEPGQTIEDIGRAEALFVQKVAELHPDADGKPVVIGNCQAGWAIMLMSAAAPDIAGVVCVAGSPLSYWSGERGKNPLRYVGGLLGGSWLASLASDLGAGQFDGQHLVSNFESLNPSNTLWSKQYNLYANVDTEEERYLDFERWWGGYFFLTEDEIRFIVDELFVGNKLAQGKIVTSKGRRLDLKAIRSPIVVIASWGDNITPPQQALNWIPDLYRDTAEIRANEQVIIYTLHESIGHLGIFVSAKVAAKEHAEFVNAVDLIEILPPGLYEMVIEERRTVDAGTDHEHEQYTVRFETREVEDILSLDDGRQDETPFAAVARLSEVNEGLYRTFVSPWLKTFGNRGTADWLRMMSPARLERLMMSDLNPFMQMLAPLAEQVRRNRAPVSADNPFLKLQQTMSAQIVRGLDAYRDTRDAAAERLFYAIYDNPGMRALAGLEAQYADANKPRIHDEALEALLQRKIDEIEQRLDRGGLPEAVMRMLLAGVLVQKKLYVDGVKVAAEARQQHPRLKQMTRQQIKEMAREQAFMLGFQFDRAIEALPSLLPSDEDKAEALAFVRSIVEKRGSVSPAAAALLRRFAEILGAGAPATEHEPALPGRFARSPRIRA